MRLAVLILVSACVFSSAIAQTVLGRIDQTTGVFSPVSGVASDALFGKSTGLSATSRFCQQLSDPAISGDFKTKEEALKALKDEIERRVLQDKAAGRELVEYGANVVECAGKFRVTPIAQGDGRKVERTKPSLFVNGKQLEEYVAGMHFHPGGSLIASIGDLIGSNSSGIPEYMVAMDASGRGLSPDIGKLSPEGYLSVVNFGNGKEVPSPNGKEVLDQLHKECQNVDILKKIAQNTIGGTLVGDVVHDAACPPKEGIPPGTFSGISADVSDHFQSSTRQVQDGAAAAIQAYTQDNTAMKQHLSRQLEGAYQYASGIATEAGVGAEYQSAVAPVMSQGRAAISSIPDRQQVAVPIPTQAR